MSFTAFGMPSPPPAPILTNSDLPTESRIKYNFPCKALPNPPRVIFSPSGLLLLWFVYLFDEISISSRQIVIFSKAGTKSYSQLCINSAEHRNFCTESSQNPPTTKGTNGQNTTEPWRGVCVAAGHKTPRNTHMKSTKVGRNTTSESPGPKSGVQQTSLLVGPDFTQTSASKI